MSEEVESSEAPVDTAYAKMFGQVVVELIFPLLWESVSALEEQ